MHGFGYIYVLTREKRLMMATSSAHPPTLYIYMRLPTYNCAVAAAASQLQWQDWYVADYAISHDAIYACMQNSLSLCI
jgi:hypothetical protein